MMTAAVAGGIGSYELSTGTALALAPLVVLSIALLVYCLVDIVRSPQVRALPKPVWALVVVLLNAPPLGSLAYLIWGRTRDDSSTPGLDADEIAEFTADGRRDGPDA